MGSFPEKYNDPEIQTVGTGATKLVKRKSNRSKHGKRV